MNDLNNQNENGNGNGTDAGIYDVPNVDVSSSTSSVGELGWPPKEASFNRLKIIDNTLIPDLQTAIEKIRYAATVELSEGQRITYRLFIPKHILDQILQISELHYLIEGVIDLDGCGIQSLESAAIVYIGKNHPNRAIEAEASLDEELAKANNVYDTDIAVKTPDRDRFKVLAMSNGDMKNEINTKLIKKGVVTDLFTLERINTLVVNQYISLLKIFGWEDADCVDLIKKNRIHICIDFNKVIEIIRRIQAGENIESLPKIVAGAGIAEHAKFTVNLPAESTVDFEMAELTEAVTDVDFANNGIYYMVSSAQLEELKDINLVYGESNTRTPAVHKTAKANGRIPANAYRGDRLNRAALKGHVPVQGRLCNFLVTYITQATLRKTLNII